MRRVIIKVIQIVLLAPATLSGPFLLMLIPTAFLDLIDHVTSLIETILVIVFAVCSFLGLLASWVVVLSGIDHVRAKKPMKTQVQTGLGVGIVGGCSILIWTVHYIRHEGLPQPGAAILSWSIFIGSPIAVLTYQFLDLIRKVPSAKQTAMATVDRES